VTNTSGIPSSSTSAPDNMVVDLALPATADKVKAILPYLKEISNADWWTGLLAAWIDFEDKVPAVKSVSFFLSLFDIFIYNLYIIATAY
jgi:hypothetical protein